MKNLFMLLMLAFFSVTSSKAQCPADPNACQATRIAFATDGTWTPGAGWGTFVIPNTNNWGNMSPALMPQLAGANWLGPAANSNNWPGPGAGSYTFSRTFCVCVAGNFNVAGVINADNSGQLNVDGNIIIGPGTVNDWNFIYAYNQPVFLGVGLHTITVTATNIAVPPTGAGPCGIITAGTITSTGAGRLCCEPGVGISGIKYNDVNNNGIIDAGDTPLPGWTFTLTGGGITYTSVTNAAGQYGFTGLPTANYTLTETMQTGWMPVAPAGGTTTINYNSGDITTINFLNKLIPDARGCCDSINSPNLVVNGSFEGGNMNFTTGSYIFQPTAGPNSVHEGRYSVLTGTDAGLVSNCWDIPDHTSCTQAGRFLVVNGRTHNPMISLVYQQQNIQVIPGEEYIFCMYYRHLPQCAFDVFDPNKLSVFVAGAGNITPVDCPEQDNCGWTKISFSFIATFPITTLSVFLDEGGIGDGNDLAFDDFAIRKKAVTPADYCHFNIATDGGSQKTITATATTALPPGFNAEWTVEELDCVTGSPIGGTWMSDPAWNPNATNFPGYCCVMGGTTPGAFFTNKCYKITRKVTSCCYVPCEDDLWVSWQQPMMMNNEREASSTGNEANGNECYISRDGVNWTKLEEKSTAAGDDITLFPNPGDGNVTIQSRHSLENSTLTVYSSDSKVILKQRIDGRKGSVNINNLPGGVYSFELVEPDGTRTYKKYVKQ